MKKWMLLSPFLFTVLLLAGYELYTSHKGRELMTAAYLVEGLNLATPVKMQVTEFYYTQGEFPASNDELGLPPPEALSGRSVKSIEVSMGGKITVTYNAAFKKDSSIVLTPTTQSGYSMQNLKWVCATDTIDSSLLESIPVPCVFVPPGTLNKLMDSIVAADESRAQAAIRSGVNINGTLNGDTPLLAAISRGRYAIAQQLIEAGADVNQKAKAYKGKTPLMQAAGSGMEQMTTLLLDKGADVDAMDDTGKTALMYAAAKGRTKLIELLLGRGANPLLTDNRGMDAVRHANKYRRLPENIKLIEDAKKTFAETLARRGKALEVNELMEAARQDDVAKIQQLIRSGQALEAVDSFNATALHHALVARQNPAALALVDAGADVNHADRDGVTPLLLAVKNGDEDVVKRLIQAGADINAEDRYHNTPLLMAIRFGQQGIVALLLDSGPTESANRALHEMFVSPAAKDSLVAIQQKILASPLVVQKDAEGLQALLVKAIETSRIPVVKYLLKNGTSVDGVAGQVPLLIAAQKGAIETVKLLVAHGANVNVANAEGKTALMFSVTSGQLPLVQYLLDSGANIDATDVNGLTALRMAKANFAEDIVALLREHKQ